MSLGNPVFSVFQSKQSRHVFFVRYKDGSIDVFSARDFKEEFPDIDTESSGEFTSAAKALQYAEEELAIDDRSIDVFGDEEGAEGEEEDEEDEDEEDTGIPKRFNFYPQNENDEGEEEN